MLRLGRLIPTDDAGVPELPGWPPVELLELLDSLEDDQLGIIDPRSLGELCEPLGGDMESQGGAEPEAELDPEAVDDGLIRKSGGVLARSRPGARRSPLAPFDREATAGCPMEPSPRQRSGVGMGPTPRMASRSPWVESIRRFLDVAGSARSRDSGGIGSEARI